MRAHLHGQKCSKETKKKQKQNNDVEKNELCDARDYDDAKTQHTTD